MTTESAKSMAARIYGIPPAPPPADGCKRCRWADRQLRAGINPTRLAMELDVADGKARRVDDMRAGRDAQIR